MNIFMELQAIQTEGSRNRGIGRYSEELSKQIIGKIDDKVTILLNALYPEHKKEIEAVYKDYADKLLFKEYRQLDNSDKEYSQKLKFIKLNDILVKYQFSKILSSQKNIIHFHSLFEGFTGKAYICDNLSDFTQNYTVVTLYDLIPLIYKQNYLQGEEIKHWYYTRLKLLYEADLLLSISESTKEDAINILGIPQNKVINISGAIDSAKFYKIDEIEDKKYKNILKKYHINRSFIMYTGGIDFRKNISFSIEAFSKIDNDLYERYQYVIVCSITKEQRDEFLNLMQSLDIEKEKIIFTGFIPDEELNILYNLTDLFIFPSIYEGFGLPVLEAMSCGAAVIGSNNSSIPEIIGRADTLFNALDIDDIALKINTVLKNKNFMAELKEFSLLQSKKFSWEYSAQKTIEAYELLQNSKKEIKKQKIAFFSPLPPQRSGISDYSLELLPFLSKYADIDIYVDDLQEEISSDFLKYNYKIFNYREFESKKDMYDNTIYQFGNSSYHVYMYDIALKHSGIVVLHDFYLSGLVNYMAHTTNTPQLFFDTLEYSHAKEGENMSVEQAIKQFPLNKKIIDNAKAIIVHSDYAKKLFEDFYADTYNVLKIDQIIKTPSEKFLQNKEKYKTKLNLHDTISIAAFGHISQTKQYDFILQSMIEYSLFSQYDFKLIFVGEFVCQHYKKSILDTIEKNNLQDRVIITGFVDDELYKEYLMASDIGLNLRTDSRGETSRALLMNMAYALTTIVNDYATFAEFENETLAKVKLNDSKDFVEKVKLLIANGSIRNGIAANAYKYIMNKHNAFSISDEYNQAMTATSKEKDVKTDIIDEIAYEIVNNDLAKDFDIKMYENISGIIKN